QRDLERRGVKGGCSGDQVSCQLLVECETMRACTCDTPHGAKMARLMFTGSWFARCVAVARWCRRKCRNWGDWMARGEPGQRRWREVLLGVRKHIIKGNCSIIANQQSRWPSSWTRSGWSAGEALARCGWGGCSGVH